MDGWPQHEPDLTGAESGSPTEPVHAFTLTWKVREKSKPSFFAMCMFRCVCFAVLLTPEPSSQILQPINLHIPCSTGAAARLTKGCQKVVRTRDSGVGELQLLD